MVHGLREPPIGRTIMAGTTKALPASVFTTLSSSGKPSAGRGFPKLRDAQFELVDALLLSPWIRSFPQLSLSPVFRRQWPSAYAAVAAGHQDVEWLRQFLSSQAPGQGRLNPLFPRSTRLVVANYDGNRASGIRL